MVLEVFLWHFSVHLLGRLTHTKSCHSVTIYGAFNFTFGQVFLLCCPTKTLSTRLIRSMLKFLSYLNWFFCQLEDNVLKFRDPLFIVSSFFSLSFSLCLIHTHTHAHTHTHNTHTHVKHLVKYVLLLLLPFCNMNSYIVNNLKKTLNTKLACLQLIASERSSKYSNVFFWISMACIQKKRGEQLLCLCKELFF
jgi:hypothetical protein